MLVGDPLVMQAIFDGGEHVDRHRHRRRPDAGSADDLLANQHLHRAAKPRRLKFPQPVRLLVFLFWCHFATGTAAKPAAGSVGSAAATLAATPRACMSLATLCPM